MEGMTSDHRRFMPVHCRFIAGSFFSMNRQHFPSKYAASRLSPAGSCRIMPDHCRIIFPDDPAPFSQPRRGFTAFAGSAGSFSLPLRGKK